jgi:hypothetical protein
MIGTTLIVYYLPGIRVHEELAFTYQSGERRRRVCFLAPTKENTLVGAKSIEENLEEAKAMRAQTAAETPEGGRAFQARFDFLA